jgi:hypothetical protein
MNTNGNKVACQGISPGGIHSHYWEHVLTLQKQLGPRPSDDFTIEQVALTTKLFLSKKCDDITGEEFEILEAMSSQVLKK